MSVPVGFLNAGLPIQRFIYDMQYLYPRYEMIDAVLRARTMNTTLRERTSDEFQDGPGKLRMLKVSYYPIQCDVISDDPTINLCASGEKQEPVQNWYRISKLLKTKTYSLNPDDLRYVDGSFTISEHGASMIAATLGAFTKQLSYDITFDIVSNRGLHLDGSGLGQRVQFYNTADGIATPGGFWQIQQEQNDAAYVDTFYIGQTPIWYWRKAISVGVNNTTLGQNFGAIAVANVYYDVQLNSVLGVNPATEGEYILTFTPQALKFVTWNRNAGMWATDIQSWSAAFDTLMRRGTESVVRTTFQMMNYNLLLDFFMHYTPCVEGQYTGRYDWHFELNWDILYTPVQTCNPQGVNGIMLYQTCPTVVPNCPTGTALSAAPDASTYQWNPDISYPYTVYNMLISGQQSYPSTTVASDAELVALMNSSISNGPTFSLNGSDIEYSGYSAISGEINGTAFTFA